MVCKIATKYVFAVHWNKACIVFQQSHNESAEILKIKQSMQEEAKRFEKETPPDSSHQEFFMQ